MSTEQNKAIARRNHRRTVEATEHGGHDQLCAEDYHNEIQLRRRRAAGAFKGSRKSPCSPRPRPTCTSPSRTKSLRETK